MLAGRVRTPSGFGVLPAVAQDVAADRLRGLLVGAGVPAGVHCCAASPPVDLLRRAGAAFVSVDATALTHADDDAIGEAVEAGTVLLLGVVPARDTGVRDTELSDARRSVEPVRSMWRRLGFSPEQLREVVVVTPTCGLAGATPAYARVALRRCREAGRALADDSA